MDRQLRALVILAALTAIVVIAAIVTVIAEREAVAPKAVPERAFPALGARAGDVAEITITAPDATVRVRRDETGRWTAPERSGFPVRSALAERAILGLSDFELVEPRTANPAWHPELRLADPADPAGAPAPAQGVRIALKDAAGGVLADLIAGKADDSGVDVAGRGRIYVRRPGEAQTWAGRGFLVLEKTISAWLDTKVYDLSRDRLKAVAVSPLEGPAFIVSRDSAADPDFALQDVPEGRAVRDPVAMASVAAAMTGFTFEDVQRADDVPFEAFATLRAETFEGLTLIAEVAPAPGGVWARVRAEGNGDAPVEAEAAAINARAGGWAFRLPEFKARQMLVTRENLLIPPGEETPGGE